MIGEKMNKKKEFKLVLAPMAGVTNRAYRQLIRETNFEAVDIIFTEMINATGISRLDNGTLNLLPDWDESCFVQIYGNNALDLSRAADYILANYPKVEGIDVNAACPVKKVVRNGSGSALLHDPDKLKEIIKQLRIIVEGTGKSLSIKIRKGWEGYENYLEVINICDQLGVDFVSFHGRTVEQMYSGNADMTVLDKIKAERCEVFWTGDVFSVESIQNIAEYSDVVSGILFARGTFGNPWIISDAKEVLNGREPKSITLQEKIDTIRRHVELLLEDYSPLKALGQFKRFIAGYTKGIRDVRQKRNAIYRMNDLNELVELLITTISADYDDEPGKICSSK